MCHMKSANGMSRRTLLKALGIASAGSFTIYAQPSAQNGWLEPLPPHKVIGNIYYVGSRGLSTYLITTPEGHILINSSFEKNVPMIRESVEKLGFKFTDVKVLLISHAHNDHCAGSALLKELSGAKYMVMAEDVPEVEAGGEGNFQNPNGGRYPKTKVDRVLHDGDEVKLGGVTLTARLTPGHTKGCTTWTMKASDGGKSYDVVIVGSPNVNAGYKLVNNALYPQIAEDFDKCFRVLKALHCDVFLGAHADYYGMMAKLAKMKPGAANPFIDPEGYKTYINEREQAFRAELAKQKK
jgi:metallo-beta-lactamase class B